MLDFWLDLEKGLGYSSFSEFWVLLTCSVLGSVSNVAVDAPPLLSDTVQPTGSQLWLNLQVERAEEALPDGLQRLTLAPEHHIAFK